jgi:hypothetical protein
MQAKYDQVYPIGFSDECSVNLTGGAAEPLQPGLVVMVASGCMLRHRNEQDAICLAWHTQWGICGPCKLAIDRSLLQ